MEVNALFSQKQRMMLKFFQDPWAVFLEAEHCMETCNNFKGTKPLLLFEMDGLMSWLQLMLLHGDLIFQMLIW